MLSDFAKISRRVGSGDILLGRLERALAWAVIATVFFLPISEALKNIGFLTCLALYVGTIWASAQRTVVPWAGWVFLTFLGAAILSAGVSPYPAEAIAGVWDVFRYTGFLFIVERGVCGEARIRAVLWAAVSGLGLTALVTVVRYWDQDVTFALSLGGYESAAVYGVMGLALVFGMYVHTQVAGWRLVWLITVAGVTVILLGLTHGRMLWGGLILVGVILGWLRSARVAILGVAISIVIVLGVALMNPAARSDIGSFGEFETYRTVGYRVHLWKKGIAMWQDAPWLGIGPRTFTLHDDVVLNAQPSKYGSLRGNAHNLWLHTAIEMGVVGVLVLAVMFAYIGYWLIRWRKCFPSSWPAAVWDGAFGSWLAMLVATATVPSFGREPAMFFVMLLAILRTGVVDGKEKCRVV